MNPDVDPLNFPFPEQFPAGPDRPDGDEPDPDDPDEDADPTADDLVDVAIDHEAQQRLWLRAIIPLLQLRSHDSDPSGRVQFAYDLMHIAACERVARLMRTDLPFDGPAP